MLFRCRLNYPAVLLCYLCLSLPADTESNRKMLAMVLSKKNIKSAFAEDGLKGVEAVRAHPGHFDIVFMDNTMPVLVRIIAQPAL